MVNGKLKKGWEEIEMFDACEILTCGVASTPTYVDEQIGVPFLSAQNVRDGVVVLDKYNFISKEFHQKLTNKNKPSKGDILYSRVGAKYGEAGVVEHNFEFSVYVSVTLIRPKKEILNNYFLKYYLNSPRIKDLAKKSISSSGVPNLNVHSVRKFPVPIPPLTEQQRIVATLDKAFAAIAKAKANAEQNLKNAKELFESYLQSVFADKGEGWEEKTLGEIVDQMMTGPFGSMLHKSDYVGNGIPVVNPQNIVDGKIVSLQKTMISKKTFATLEKYALREGDIVMARRGEMGRCAIVKKENIGWLCGTGSLVIRAKKEKVNEEFLNLYLGTTKIKNHLEKASIGATMNNLNQSILSEIEITLPPIKKQKEIMHNLDALSAETKKLEAIYERKINDLDELKKSILQKAFNGEL